MQPLLARSWHRLAFPRVTSRIRCLSSKKALREKLVHQQQMDEVQSERRIVEVSICKGDFIAYLSSRQERAAEARVARLKAQFEENTSGFDENEKPRFSMADMTKHPAFKYGLLCWLVSTSVAVYLYWRRPKETEVDILAKDFDDVFQMEMELRRKNGGRTPEDPELLVWEAKYRDLYHRDDFMMSPWLSAKLESLPGWTWDLNEEEGLQGTKDVLREKERQRDARAREDMAKGDAVDRAALRTAETHENLVNRVSKWFS